MKRWGDDNRGCVSCCNASVRMCTRCALNDHKLYANREECERLLKLWDDANGSIAEWREANERGMLKYDEDNKGCNTCICENDTEKCGKWHEELRVMKYSCNGKFYANKTQIADMLKPYENMPRGSQEDLTFRCPWCGSVKCTSMDSDNPTRRVCECGEVWFPEIDYTEEEDTVKDLDFRVGDKVFCLTGGNGVINVIDPECCDGEYAISVLFDTGENDDYTYTGKRYWKDPFRSLYHGHNLKVNVEEKKPERMIERWLTVFYDNNAGETVSIINESDKEPSFGPPCFTLIHGPVKVNIPE